MEKIIKIIAEELNIKPSQVENTIKLIDEGNTIPFIARYRKEVTGGLSDETLRDLGDRLNYLRNLEQRKEEVVKSIDEQGKLTDEILKAIAIAKTLAEVEDIYRPYKQKKKTRATVAKAKGLEPLAKIIIEQKEEKDIYEIAKEYINIDKLSEEDKKNKDKVVNNEEEAIQGALDIIAEDISDNSKYRKEIKRLCYREGVIVTKATKTEEKSPLKKSERKKKENEMLKPKTKLKLKRKLIEKRMTVKEFIKDKLDVDEKQKMDFLRQKLSLTNELKYQIEITRTEEGKRRFKMLLNQIEALKNDDHLNYINFINEKYGNYKNEIQNLIHVREKEQRINYFMNDLIEERDSIKLIKKIKGRNVSFEYKI